MQIVHTISDLRKRLAQAPQLAFVPTMGNLHQGHLSLVHRAKACGGTTVASIFVNRLQFLPHEDFDTYPRSWEDDCAKLSQAGCDVLFAPSEEELYPEPQRFKVQPDSALADSLEGHFRPGFFVGVCTVVLKLMGCVFAQSSGERVLVLGQKDYQQYLVVQRMVQEFALPVRVVTGPIVRAPDGLALSSRNNYLSHTERAQATQLYATLQGMAQTLRAGLTPIAEVETQAMQTLSAQGWQPDYLVARRATDLQPAQKSDALVILGAARLGKTRLIDNVLV
jgi:pantoate--beta-alanine ligase